MGTLNITENGIYDVTEKASANVQIPLPSGTKEINITQNGTIIEDIKNYENAEINVNVPEPSGEISITSNGVYNVSNYVSANVNIEEEEKAYKHLVSYTLESDMQNFTIPATEEAKKCTKFIIRFTGDTSASDWIYIGLNATSAYYNNKNTTFDFVCGAVIMEELTFQDGKKQNKFNRIVGTGMMGSDVPMNQWSSFAFKTYSASINILAGAQIEIYGM